MNKKFHSQIQIRFREADPARILYFAQLVSRAHDVFEDFITAVGFTWDEWFSGREWLIPIRHVEADYRSPFLPGKVYDVETSVESFGETSFKMKYVFSRQGKIHGTVRMVHAVLAASTQEKTPLPPKIRQCLEVYLEESSTSGGQK